MNLAPRKKKRTFLSWLKRHGGQLIIGFLLVLLVVQVLLPLYFLLVKSVKTPTEDLSRPFGWPISWCWENYSLAWEYVKGAFANSLIITSLTSVGIVVVAALAAYPFAFFEFPGRRVIFLGFLSLIMIPGILTLLSRYSLVVKMGLLNTFWGVILPGIAGQLPYSIFLFTTFFRQIPKGISEAATIDGARGPQIFFHFVLPLSRPILATVFLQSFIAEWGDYLWARLILTDQDLWTLPVTLVSLTSYYGSTISYGVPFAGYVLSSIPMIVLFAVGSKQLIAGLTSGSVKM